MKLLGIGTEILASVVSSIVNRKGSYAVILADGRELTLQEVENLLGK